MSNLGRPIKGKSRRVPITVHVSIDTLDKIDKYVEEHVGLTKSDFYNNACIFYMKHLGILKDDDSE